MSAHAYLINIAINIPMSFYSSLFFPSATGLFSYYNFPTDIKAKIFQKRSWHQKSSSRGSKYLNSYLVLVRQAVSGLQQPHESGIELNACWSFEESVPGTGVSGTHRRCWRAPFTCNTRNANRLTAFPILFPHMNSSLTLLFTLTAQRQAHLDIKSMVSGSEEQTSCHRPATHATFSRSYVCPP